jgi:hypothetical protein
MKRSVLVFVLLFLAQLGVIPVTLATDYQWNMVAGDGNWNDVNNWTPFGVPNSAGDTAWIDNNPLLNVTVTLDNLSPHIGGLTIDSGDALDITNSRHLYLRDATVTNNGTINLTGAVSYLTAYNSQSILTGAGSVVLGGSLNNRLRQDYGGSFINDTLHTIKGGGIIEAPVTNRGTILATSSAAPLRITNTITNTGVLGALGGADRILDLRSDIYGGQIKPQDGTVELWGAALWGVALTAGAVNVEQHSDLLGATTSAADITVKNGQHLYLKANGPTLANLTNNGTITLTGDNSYLTAYNNEATLTGTGEVVLGGKTGNKIRQDYGGSLVNDTHHTIRGGGAIENITVTNKGKIIADHPTTALTVSGSTINNQTGLLQALDGSTLAIRSSTINGGQIIPGNTMEIYDAYLYGTSIGKGVINVTRHSWFRSNNSLSADTTVNVQDGQHLYLHNEILTNNGVINLTGDNSYLTSYNFAATLTGTGEVVLGGKTGNKIRQDYGGTLTNDTQHTIRGGGAIEGIVLTNKGKIIADNGTLKVASSTIHNQTGLMQVLDGSTLAIQSSTINGGQIIPGNTLELYDAYLYGTSIGKGTVNVTNHSWLRSNNTFSADTTVNVQDGQHLYLHNEILTNNGTINLTGTNSYLTSYNFASTLTGTGEVVLGGLPGNKIRQDYGGTLTNDTQHTIRGGGAIENITVTNKGKIIADHPTTALTVSGSTINNQTGLLQALDGSTLAIRSSTINGGQIIPGNTLELYDAYLYGTSIGKGIVNVTKNSWFRSNNALSADTTVNVQDGQHLYLHNEILTNNGTINLTGTNSYLTSYNFASTLTGTGQVVLGGKPGNMIREDYGGTITNDTQHTIRGGGTINAPVVNKGKILGDNGILTINREVTGDGSVRFANTGILDLNANLTTGDFTMDKGSILDLASNKYIDLKKSFVFFQNDENSWKWGAGSYLSLSGLGALQQRLEIGGKEGGGFDNNFDLNKLSLSGSNTYAYLTDWIDNGNRGSNECLYVDELFVGAGSTLNLNHLHLWLKDYGLVTATDDWVNGHGRIVDDLIPQPAVPVPPSVLLLGSGLLGLAGWRRFRKS